MKKMKKQVRKFVRSLQRNSKKAGKATKKGAKKAAHATRATVGLTVMTISGAAYYVVGFVRLVLRGAEQFLQLPLRTLQWAAVGLATLGLLISPWSADKPQKTEFAAPVAKNIVPIGSDEIPDGVPEVVYSESLVFAEPHTSAPATSAVRQQLAMDQAQAAGDDVEASYRFGRMSAAKALADGLALGRAWALVHKEINAQESGLHKKDVKRGWDDELAEHKELQQV